MNDGPDRQPAPWLVGRCDPADPIAVCGIVDAQVAHEVFGNDPSPAGREFFKWLHLARGRLVVGGKLLKELEAASADFRQWASEAGRAGLMTTLNKEAVADRTKEIERRAKLASNDAHVLAVAQVGGARLLFTNDRELARDFRSKVLIDNPRGRVYHTRDVNMRDDNKRVSQTHRRLLNDGRLCRSST